MACVSDDKIKEARAQLDKIRSDPEMMERIRLQEAYEWDETTSINDARREGEKIGEERGRTQGERIGEERGKEESKKEIAINLIKAGIGIDLIMKATGLSQEEIEKLIL